MQTLILLWCRSKCVEDLRESIAEMDEMEQLRIEAELEKQHSSSSSSTRTQQQHDNRDSGVNDLDIQDTQQRSVVREQTCTKKGWKHGRTFLSNEAFILRS